MHDFTNPLQHKEIWADREEEEEEWNCKYRAVGGIPTSRNEEEETCCSAVVFVCMEVQKKGIKWDEVRYGYFRQEAGLPRGAPNCVRGGAMNGREE